jgi:hypothetical protein
MANLGSATNRIVAQHSANMPHVYRTVEAARRQHMRIVIRRKLRAQYRSSMTCLMMMTTMTTMMMSMRNQFWKRVPFNSARHRPVCTDHNRIT